MVLLALSVLLFVVNGLYFTGPGTAPNRNAQNISTVSTNIGATVSPLMFVSEGGEIHRPPYYTVHPGGMIEYAGSPSRNIYLPDILTPDWTFIVSVIFSLFVVLLSFPMIAGERENGTLKLSLVNPVNRMAVLTAKYGAVMTLTMIPLILGMVISITVMGLYNPSMFSASILPDLLLIFAFAGAYLSLFTLLGLMVSSLLTDRTVVLFILLSIWVLVANVVPNVAELVSKRVSDIPGELETVRKIGPMINEQIHEGVNAVREKAERGEISDKEEAIALAENAYMEGQRMLARHYTAFQNAMIAHRAVTRNISRLSPAALFRNATEDIAGTGLDNERMFLRTLRSYSEIYDEYIRQKVGTVVPATNWSFATNIIVNGENVMINSPRPEQYDGPMDDFPYFTPPEPSVTARLAGSLFDLVGLLFWNLVLSMGAMLAFQRMDVT